MAVRERIGAFLQIPPEVLPEFRQVALRRNRVSLLVICVMIVGMELFNMARVLFWSASGLGTLNNRIYFTLYLSLFLAAAGYLALAHWTRAGRVRVRLGLQYGAVLFFLLWHICINAYDLMRNPDAEIGIYYTAVLGLSVFILMPAPCGGIFYGAAYAVFLGLAGSILSAGDQINVTCTTIVALAVSVTNSYHHVTIISQRQEIGKMNEQLQRMAQRDALTGLFNQAAFQSCVKPHLGREGIAFLVVDLDNFKAVNDRYGHPCGDFVLRELAARMDAAFPDALCTGRIGGDEFAVFLADAGGEERLTAAAQALIHSVSQITWHGRDVGAGCSVGICCAGGAASYERLYSEADRALYQAKGRGKSQCFLTRLP